MIKSSLQYMAQRTEPGLSYCEAQLSLEMLGHADQITSPFTGVPTSLSSWAALCGKESVSTHCSDFSRAAYILS